MSKRKRYCKLMKVAHMWGEITNFVRPVILDGSLQLTIEIVTWAQGKSSGESVV